MAPSSQPFPLSKLAFMFVRQTSAPLAKRIRDRAKTHPGFLRYVVQPPAKFYHFYEVKIKLRVLNLGGRVDNASLPKLDEAKTLELGSQLVAEMTILSLASMIAANEVRKSKQREEEKEAEVQKYLRDTRMEIEDYKRTFVAHGIQIQRLRIAMEKLVSSSSSSSSSWQADRH